MGTKVSTTLANEQSTSYTQQTILSSLGKIYLNYLLSLSSIMTVTLLVPPSLMPYGKDTPTITMKNVSSFSDIVSSIIGIDVLGEEQVAPAGNVKLYISGGTLP